MKKSIFTFVLCFVLVLGLYPKTAIVSNIDYNNDIVTVMDANGFTWDFFGTEDYEKGDVVSIIMDSNGTESIFDDIILIVQYSGYTI